MSLVLMESLNIGTLINTDPPNKMADRSIMKRHDNYIIKKLEARNKTSDFRFQILEVRI